MRIFVKAKPNSKVEKVETPPPKLWQSKSGNTSNEKEWFTVWVKEPPSQNKANIAITKALAKHFNILQSQVKLISGFSSKNKIFEILI